MLKTIQILFGTVVLAGIMYALTLSRENIVHYERFEQEVIPDTHVETEYPEDWLKEAEEAKQAVLKKKQLEADLATLDAEIKEKQEKRKQLVSELEAY